MEGGVEEEPVKLAFTVHEIADGSVFYMADTETADPLKTDAWYTAVQKQS
ncbi:hypothetical protein MRBL20_002890 [Peribacillus frigoritolerans]